MDRIFYKIEKATESLLDDLTEQEYAKEINRFDKNPINQNNGEISSSKKKEAKDRFRSGLMNWLIHQRYFNFILHPQHGNLIFQRFMNKFSQIKETSECSICFSESNTKVILECNHSFCKECLNVWFKTQIQQHFKRALCLAGDFCLTCPLCRHKAS